jgi:hypothetical protein
MGRRDLHVHPRMSCMEPGQSRHKPTNRECRWHFDPKYSVVGDGRELGRRVVNLVERAADGVEVRQTFGRQSNGAIPSPEQADTQIILQAGDLAADGALGHPEFLGGPGEAAVSGSGIEGAERRERRQTAPAYVIHDLRSCEVCSRVALTVKAPAGQDGYAKE